MRKYKQVCDNPCEKVKLSVTQSQSGYSEEGESISLRYVVTNISGDVLTGDLSVFTSEVETVTSENVNLTPGESVSFEGNYLVKQSDLNFPEIKLVSFVMLNNDCFGQSRISELVNIHFEREQTQLYKISVDMEQLRNLQAQVGDKIWFMNFAGENAKAFVLNLTEKLLSGGIFSILIPPTMHAARSEDINSIGAYYKPLRSRLVKKLISKIETYSPEYMLQTNVDELVKNGAKVGDEVSYRFNDGELLTSIRLTVDHLLGSTIYVRPGPGQEEKFRQAYSKGIGTFLATTAITTGATIVTQVMQEVIPKIFE